MKEFKRFLVGATILVVIFIVSSQNKKQESNTDISHGVYVYGDEISVKLVNQVIKVDVVSTPEARSLGLSGRASLNKDQGMLFVFDTPGNYSFWMKDMNFPIDIIWFDEMGKVVYIQKDAQPESYPEAFTPPKEKTSKYVLEVFSGFSLKHNLQVGDAIEFLPK